MGWNDELCESHAAELALKFGTNFDIYTGKS